MIDEKRVLQVARELSMNSDKARKLLEDARSEPVIMKRMELPWNSTLKRLQNGMWRKPASGQPQRREM